MQPYYSVICVSAEILSLSDDLTKTIDEYKRVVIQGETPSKPLTSNAAKDGVLPTGMELAKFVFNY